VKLREAEQELTWANPVGERDVRELDLGPAEEELLAAIVAEPRSETARPQVSAHLRQRPVLIAAAVVLLALTALVIGLPGGDDDGPRGALAVLDRVAAAAAEQPPPGAALPYGYLKTRGTYVDTTVYGGEAWSNYHSEVAETWVAPDGSGRRRTASFVPGFVSPADREAWERAGRPPFLAHGWGRHVSSESFGPGSFAGNDAFGADLSDLPTDPEELSRWLLNRATNPAGGGGNGFPLSVKTLTLVAELLQNPFAPSDLRASLYEAEALVPGIENLGSARDGLGRAGIAVGASSANSGAPTVYSLIVDPETGAVLATEEKQLRAPSALPELDESVVVASTAYLESKRTASIPEELPAN
jgi:hypothetical protein